MKSYLSCLLTCEILSFILILISKVDPLQLSLSQTTNSNRENILWDISSRRALCYPTEEMMGSISGGMNVHQWGFTTAWNFSIAIERVGEVFCKELGFSYMESIYPVPLNSTSNKILWAASCLGYEPQISHCQYREFHDPSVLCQEFVGLRCKECHSEVNVKDKEVVNITSPGFPNSYKDYTICDWLFKSESCSSFTITILHFYLPEESSHGHCSNGFLKVHGSKSNQDLDYCGSIKNKTITVDCPRLHIHWFAGIFHPRPYERPGFSLQIRVEKETTKEKSSIISVYKENSMPASAIVGLIVGVCAMMILLVAAVIIVRYSLRKLEHRQSRRNIATVLQSRGTARERDSLPTLPIAFVQDTEDENRKISLTSAIYEDIEKANLQTSYLLLEDQKRRETFSSVKDKESENKTNPEKYDFNFQIPTLTITHNNELLPSCSDFSSSCSEIPSFNDLKSQSEPSDMPSNLSFFMDQDSVFGNELNVDLLKAENGSCNKTYTKDNCKVDSERRSSSLTPISNLLWSKRYKELSRSPSLSHNRFSSEPNVNTKGLPAGGSKCPRMNSGTFSTSHINDIDSS